MTKIASRGPALTSIARRETFDLHHVLLNLNLISFSFFFSLICLPMTTSFGNFADRSRWRWCFGVLLFRTLRAVVSRFWHSFQRLRPLKSGVDLLTNQETAQKSFSSKLKVYGSKKSRMCQAQIKFHDQSTKLKLLVLKSRPFCIVHWSEVTLFYKCLDGYATVCRKMLHRATIRHRQFRECRFHRMRRFSDCTFCRTLFQRVHFSSLSSFSARTR